MPYKPKNSKCWYASFTDGSGKRIRCSTGTKDRKEAEALEAKWKLEAYRQKQWEEEPPKTFEELMLAYLTATQDQKRSANRDRCIAANLRDVFAGREMNSISGHDIRAYIEHRKEAGRKPSTINRELAMLSAAINYANVEWEWVLPNPVKGRRLWQPEGRVRWITKDQAKTLINTAGSGYLRNFIVLALNTGCRSQELLGLEWGRVSMTERLIFLEARHTKGKKRRSIPINDAARCAILSQWQFHASHCPDSPWVFCSKSGSRITQINKGFASLCRRAGIDDFTPHDLRHTCASWLVMAGTSLLEVKELLGHSSVIMTEKYAHLAPDNVRAAVDKLNLEVKNKSVVTTTKKS
jgi:integrase